MESQANSQFDKFIYSEINEFRLEASFDEQWSKMTVALDKNNFMKFTPSRFNFYYLLLIVSGGIVSFFLYNNYSNQKDATNVSTFSINRNEMPVGNSPEQNSANVSTDIENNKIKKSKDNNIVGISPSEKVNSGETKKELSNELTKKDSIVAIKENTQEMKVIRPDSVVKPVVKKIKYVMRRDTIIKVDTTHLRRKR